MLRGKLKAANFGFGFEVDTGYEAVKNIFLEDKELLHFLQFGFGDYSAETSSVSWFTLPSIST